MMKKMLQPMLLLFANLANPPLHSKPLKSLPLITGFPFNLTKSLVGFSIPIFPLSLKELSVPIGRNYNHTNGHVAIEPVDQLYIYLFYFITSKITRSNEKN